MNKINKFGSGNAWQDLYVSHALLDGSRLTTTANIARDLQTLHWQMECPLEGPLKLRGCLIAV